MGNAAVRNSLGLVIAALVVLSLAACNGHYANAGSRSLRFP